MTTKEVSKKRLSLTEKSFQEIRDLLEKNSKTKARDALIILESLFQSLNGDQEEFRKNFQKIRPKINRLIGSEKITKELMQKIERSFQKTKNFNRKRKTNGTRKHISH